MFISAFLLFEEAKKANTSLHYKKNMAQSGHIFLYFLCGQHLKNDFMGVQCLLCFSIYANTNGKLSNPFIYMGNLARPKQWYGSYHSQRTKRHFHIHSHICIFLLNKTNNQSQTTTNTYTINNYISLTFAIQVDYKSVNNSSWHLQQSLLRGYTYSNTSRRSW